MCQLALIRLHEQNFIWSAASVKIKRQQYGIRRFLCSSRDWENSLRLFKPSTSSNSPNLSRVYILRPGMQLCWYQPTHGAYLHLVTEPFSGLLPNCGTVLGRRSETFRASHLLRELSKDTFLRQLIHLFSSFQFSSVFLFYFIIIILTQNLIDLHFYDSF